MPRKFLFGTSTLNIEFSPSLTTRRPALRINIHLTSDEDLYSYLHRAMTNGSEEMARYQASVALSPYLCASPLPVRLSPDMVDQHRSALTQAAMFVCTGPRTSLISAGPLPNSFSASPPHDITGRLCAVARQFAGLDHRGGRSISTISPQCRVASRTVLLPPGTRSARLPTLLAISSTTFDLIPPYRRSGSRFTRGRRGARTHASNSQAEPCGIPGVQTAFASLTYNQDNSSPDSTRTIPAQIS
ncbi:hypothetical protein OBBRIDRAFT_803143 [Obba rivulosa]|uniref:Uncharacterized protein n=1 Tax=Obba rivulosa TaxID=1052685 RepID=A0A8E2AYR3_9APHY|nr:hypothetical protein OBBRIDRAFT_803143 [Obba rivulosa]